MVYHLKVQITAMIPYFWNSGISQTYSFCVCVVREVLVHYSSLRNINAYYLTDKITQGHDGSAVSTLASGTKLKAPKCSAIKIAF